MDVQLVDGRSLRIPLDWYPHLEQASPKKRKHYVLEFGGEAIWWPDLEEGVSVNGLLQGNKAPSTSTAMTGKWPTKLDRRLRQIEKEYEHQKSIPSDRSKGVARKTKTLR